VDATHHNWAYRCGLREYDEHYVVEKNGKKEEKSTTEHHQYRPSFFAFQNETETTDEYP
jgi:hypothetical protein